MRKLVSFGIWALGFVSVLAGIKPEPQQMNFELITCGIILISVGLAHLLANLRAPKVRASPFLVILESIFVLVAGYLCFGRADLKEAIALQPVTALLIPGTSFILYLIEFLLAARLPRHETVGLYQPPLDQRRDDNFGRHPAHTERPDGRPDANLARVPTVLETRGSEFNLDAEIFPGILAQAALETLSTGHAFNALIAFENGVDLRLHTDIPKDGVARLYARLIFKSLAEKNISEMTVTLAQFHWHKLSGEKSFKRETNLIIDIYQIEMNFQQIRKILLEWAVAAEEKASVTLR